jgi:cysteine desulfurase
LFHTDAVQAGGKIPLDVNRLQVDLLSLSAHKLHGPKGVGALYFRKGTGLAPIIFGGGQERGLRSATENVAGIVGFGAAAELTRKELNQEAARLAGLREYIATEVLRNFPNAYLYGHPTKRLPGHLSFGFRGQEREVGKLLDALDQAGVAVSAGSACSANHSGEPSSVLLAMGYDAESARGLIRVSLGRFSTQQEVDCFLDVLSSAVSTLSDTARSASLAGLTNPAEVAERTPPIELSATTARPTKPHAWAQDGFSSNMRARRN